MGNAHLHALHIHPVKAVRGPAPREAVVEPWGPAGDRRWVLIDDGGKVVTQRLLPRLALAAELLPGGAVRLSAPGMRPLTVLVPRPLATVTVEIFRDKVEAVPAEDEAARLGRLLPRHRRAPGVHGRAGHAPARRPAVRAAR